ncbi:SOS response-associated peptidase, partial [Enterobacter hormaechei]|nr:SOS response-associated peptidase [Enterobacter hormaechei]
RGKGGKKHKEKFPAGEVPADKFTGHAVTRALGNVKNQGPELIEPIS